jgi:aerobic-type carbon monoxide dehydrogenase small subunit (CoxS/CutS family)
MGAEVAVDLTVRFKVNGDARSVITDPERRLLDVLREELHLTGTKYGCGEGQCGACAVHVDGEPARSCLLR